MRPETLRSSQMKKMADTSMKTIRAVAAIIASTVSARSSAELVRREIHHGLASPRAADGSLLGSCNNGRYSMRVPKAMASVPPRREARPAIPRKSCLCCDRVWFSPVVPRLGPSAVKPPCPCRLCPHFYRVTVLTRPCLRADARCWPCAPLTAMRRGFIASGTSRTRSIFSRPSSKEAPLTCT